MIEIKKEDKKPIPSLNLVSFAFDLGFTIAVPLVVFAFLGRWADKTWEVSPWGLILGLILSVLITIIMITRKVKKIFNNF